MYDVQYARYVRGFRKNKFKYLLYKQILATKILSKNPLFTFLPVLFHRCFFLFIKLKFHISG